MGRCLQRRKMRKWIRRNLSMNILIIKVKMLKCSANIEAFKRNPILL
jgi:hypothetical protein